MIKIARRKRRDPLGSLGATALGLGGLGVTVGVSAAVAGRASAGTPAAGMMGGFGQIAGAASIAVPVIAGGAVLSQVRKLGKRKKRRRR